MYYPLLLIALTGLLAGCGSFLPEHRTLPGPSAIEVYQARREPPPPVQPALSVVPNAAINEPQPATINQSPLPVWNDAQLVRVDLDAYVNEKGEAFGPSVKYVVKQPGGWNVDALRNPTRAYVPSENVPPVPSKNGYTANPMVAPGSAQTPAGPSVRPIQASLIQDLSSVRVTGFVERSQEPLARSMAQNGEIPIFDESLGWILVPSSALVPSNQIPAPVVPYQTSAAQPSYQTSAPLPAASQVINYTTPGAMAAPTAYAPAAGNSYAQAPGYPVMQPAPATAGSAYPTPNLPPPTSAINVR
jgi:hypothetical protein